MSVIKKELIGIFSLDYNRMSIPTNNSMYDCSECIKTNIPHEIKDSTLMLEADYPRYSAKNYWVRKCTGCGKMDGPWSHFGDD